MERTGIRQPYLPRYKTAMEQYSKLGQRVLRRILSRDDSWIPFDQTGKKTMDFGTYPKTEQEYTPAELINAFRADLTTNRKEKVAITHYFTDLICIYNVNGTLEKQLRGPDHFASVFKRI